MNCVFFYISSQETLRICNPLFIGGLIRYFEGVGTKRDAYMYAAAIATTSILINIMHHILFFSMQRVGWHMRSATCALMYKKVN